MNNVKITREHIDSCIKAEYCFTAHNAVGEGCPRVDELKLLTICVLVLRNGFTVTGESACVHPDNFDEAIGARLARQKAYDKIWMLEGYLLKDTLYVIEDQRDLASQVGGMQE